MGTDTLGVGEKTEIWELDACADIGEKVPRFASQTGVIGGIVDAVGD